MTGTTKPTADSSHATIFHSLLASDLPTTDLTPQRLVGEGQTIVAAGTLTTAHYLKTTMYYLLINPKILSRLRNELEEAIPNAADLPPFKNLDLLTYLNAVINEGFRISHGIIQRLTRIAPDEVLTYKSYTIPAGTPIGMSSWDMHLSPTIFPSPHTFNPDRWLESGAEQKRKFLVNFTKGSRMCLGKDLARTEILYTICTLVRRWGMDGEMSLYKTGQEDVDIAHDFFNPFAKIESKGVRVVLKGVRT
jgi:cytochrome P450